MTKPLSVLLVEDDPDEKDIFVSFLAPRTDIVVNEFFDSGQAMLQYLETRPSSTPLPDIIFLDQNMPRFNGFQVLERLKNSSRYAAVPVVIFSTYVAGNLEEGGLRAGALAVFTKPLTAAGYNEMVDQVMALLKK